MVLINEHKYQYTGVIQMLLRSGFYIWALDFVQANPRFFPSTIIPLLLGRIYQAAPGKYRT